MTETTPTKAETALEGIERRYRESIERNSLIDRTWASREVREIRELVRDDGNVDWTTFVTHCGGILNVAAMVDERGRPDTDRIIPLVDELFAKHAVTEYAGGITMTRRPRNRPYSPQAAAVDRRFPADPGSPPDLSSEAPMRTTTRR